MKYIELEILPFSINKKFNKAIKEINCDTKIKLLGRYEARLNLKKILINKTKAIFFIDELQTIDEMDNVLIDYYGVPKYIDSNRLNVWKINGIYISHGIVTTRLDEKLHILSVCLVAPTGIYDYCNYQNILEIHEKLKTNFNLKKASFLYVDLFNKVNLRYESINYVYQFSISKKNINIHIATNDISKQMFQRQLKYAYKNISEIYDIIYSFLKNRILYDTSLYK